MFRYDRLDELIQKTGKKKNHLSIAMGHSGRYLNDAKKQKTNIKGDDLLFLAAELGTTPEYLSGESDEKKPVQKNELSDIRRAVDEELDKMTDEELEMALRLVRVVKNTGGIK